MTLTEFLLARITADEAACRQYEAEVLADLGGFDGALRSEIWVDHTREMGYPYIAIDSTRVLADCEAKRKIIERVQHDFERQTPGWHTAQRILGDLAAPYADRPGYDPAWAPAE